VKTQRVRNRWGDGALAPQSAGSKVSCRPSHNMASLSAGC